MPPKQAKPKQLRCAYVEGGQRCKRPGSGNPPLCEGHRIVLEEEASRQPRPGERLVGLLGRVFRGQKISDRQIFSGIEDLAGMFQQHPGYEELRAHAEAQVRERAQQWQRPGTRRPAAPRRPPGPDPRIVLGFAVGQKVSAAEVKQRHRELARKHHPDRGGSVAKMQEINAAVDQLLASM